MKFEPQNPLFAGWVKTGLSNLDLSQQNGRGGWFAARSGKLPKNEAASWW